VEVQLVERQEQGVRTLPEDKTRPHREGVDESRVQDLVLHA